MCLFCEFGFRCVVFFVERWKMQFAIVLRSRYKRMEESASHLLGLPSGNQENALFHDKFPVRQEQALRECSLVSIRSICSPCMHCPRILHKAAFY